MHLFFVLGAMLSPVAATAAPAVVPAPVAAAQSANPVAPAPAAAAAATKPKLICRQEAAPGSTIPGKKICATAAQWRAAER